MDLREILIAGEEQGFLNPEDIRLLETLFGLWYEQGQSDDGIVTFEVPQLMEKLGIENPQMIQNCLSKLRYIPVYCVETGFNFGLIDTCYWYEKAGNPIMGGVRINHLVIEILKKVFSKCSRRVNDGEERATRVSQE